MDIFLIDDLPPETVAMLAALYSRSPQSVQEHLKVVAERGAESFMATYYVGYGHKSIGDCGTTSMFIEWVSLLAAKAIQDNPLYNGQEASTRYLDFGNTSLVNPCGPDGDLIQRTWMELYTGVLAALLPFFEMRFPREEGQKKSVWRKAIKARAFDVARGFLPAGVRTLVAWHSNLRQTADHLKLMRHHPLKEVVEIADGLERELLKRYPSSFGHKRYPEQEAYLKSSMAEWAFSDRKACEFECHPMLIRAELMEHALLLASRPPKTELHQRFRQYGDIIFKFMLDFGSYRDMQRQRSCVQEMPLLTTRHGFHPWYLDQLPAVIRREVDQTIKKVVLCIEALDASPEDKQYLTPIGFNCPVRITCSLPSAVYIAELRSGATVHPTVRTVAQQMGDALVDLVPSLAMHHDKSPGVWDIRRGEQDIVKKDEA
ncbi:MAG TPA: FAD-dependent thymidylate synthase [Thermoleophilia bacterium]|nr:FAD-dependent thymidylate synthase [Thermoleophilia bacterium]